MARFLLDTNVLSELTRPAPDAGVVAWMSSAREDDLYVSVVTLAEINRGIQRLRTGRKQADYKAWLAAVIDRFDNRILPISANIALVAGELDAASERGGRQLELADALIAATTLVHGLTLVTRNVRDFQASAVPLLNPWARA